MMAIQSLDFVINSSRIISEIVSRYSSEVQRNWKEIWQNTA